MFGKNKIELADLEPKQKPARRRKEKTGDLGLTFWGAETALIMTRKNEGVLVKITPKMAGFFVNPQGLFKLDSEMEYRHGKQPLFFYNSHGSKLAIEKVYKIRGLFFAHKYEELMTTLKEEWNYITFTKPEEVLKAFQEIVEHESHLPIDIDVDKFLPRFRACTPMGLKMLTVVSHGGRKAIESLYPRLKAPIPIIAVMIGVVIFVIIMQNIPDYIRQIQSMFGSLIH